MKYTIEDLESDIEAKISELSAMRRAKGHDYSGHSTDTLFNLREFGWEGVLVRLNDKINRLKSFYKQGTLKVADERVIDTMNDTINYAIYMALMYEGEVGK